jgi:D-3-phosphoglycerate dehydrogenase
MPVLAYDPFIEEETFTKFGAERVAFEELLKSSDVLSFHVPKTAMTNSMLNRSHFEYIHRGVILINTSRGSVVKENDLCEALSQGWVSAAGLDVFEKEPLSAGHRLLQFPQVVLTPHIGANTSEAYYKSSEMAALKILRFFVDGSTADTLPPKAAWYNQPNPWA